MLLGKKTMQKSDICLPRSPPPNAGCVGVSLFPWLPLIGCDKVTRTNEKRKEKFLAYRERRAGEWLLGSVGRVALDCHLPQLAQKAQSVGQGSLSRLGERLPRPQKEQRLGVSGLTRSREPVIARFGWRVLCEDVDFSTPQKLASSSLREPHPLFRAVSVW